MVEEILYPALEDYQIDIMIGEGPAARSIKLDLPPFTLVGATTRAGMLTNPLRDRFGIVARLEFYNQAEIGTIVRRSAGLLEVSLAEDGAAEIARRSRGTPRIANRLLRRVRDYAQVKADGKVTKPVADAALIMLDVDALGLDVMDRKLLLAVIEKFAGGPVGIDNLAAAIGEERDTIEDVLEPFLIQQGYLMRTSAWRVATVRRLSRHFGRGRAAAPGNTRTVGVGFHLTRPEPFRVAVRSITRTPTRAGWCFTRSTCCSWSARAPSSSMPRASTLRASPKTTGSCSWPIDFSGAGYHFRHGRQLTGFRVLAEVVKMGHASFVFRQRVERGAELLVEADVTVALVDRARDRPARIPEKLKRLLERDA